jgi:hypothetical protein
LDTRRRQKNFCALSILADKRPFVQGKICSARIAGLWPRPTTFEKRRESGSFSLKANEFGGV